MVFTCQQQQFIRVYSKAYEKSILIHLILFYESQHPELLYVENKDFLSTSCKTETKSHGTEKNNWGQSRKIVKTMKD